MAIAVVRTSAVNIAAPRSFEGKTPTVLRHVPDGDCRIRRHGDGDDGRDHIQFAFHTAPPKAPPQSLNRAFDGELM